MTEMMLRWAVRVCDDSLVRLNYLSLSRSSFLLSCRREVRNLLKGNAWCFTVKKSIRVKFEHKKHSGRLTVEAPSRNVHSKKHVHLLCRPCHQLLKVIHKARRRSSWHEISSRELSWPGRTIRCQLHIGRTVELKIFCKGKQRRQIKFTVSLNVLGSFDRKRNGENVTCHHSEPSSTTRREKNKAIGVFIVRVFPKVQLFSLPLFCWFSHNYDSPKKKILRMPKNRSTNEAGEPNITQMKEQLSSHFMINLFDGPCLPFSLVRFLPPLNRTNDSKRIANCFRCHFDFDCLVEFISLQFTINQEVEFNEAFLLYRKRRFVYWMEVWFVEVAIWVWPVENCFMFLLEECFNWAMK